MLNSADKKAVVKTVILYISAMTIFVCIFGFLNQILLIHTASQIKAIIALLLIVAISFARISTEFSFLICGILGSYIMWIPLSRYTEYLFQEAGSTSIFMIAVSGAVIAALARNDLLEGLRTTKVSMETEEKIDLEHQVSVFCLFLKLQKFIKRKNSYLAFIVFLLQNMLLFVSSVVSAQTFSAMIKTGRSKSHEEDTYLNAGILCMCVSGCLLIFFFIKSPWWLFFSGLAKDVKVYLPIAVLIYAFLSFLHGYKLLSLGESKSTIKTEKIENSHPLAGRHFIIYISLIAVFLAFTLPNAISYIGASNANAALYLQKINDVIAKLLQGTLAATDGVNKIEGIVSHGIYSSAEYINLGISLLMILILAGIIAATVITRRLMQKNSLIPNKSKPIDELKNLILGDKGIKSVISIIVLIVTILGFRDMVNECVSPAVSSVSLTNSGAGIAFFSPEGLTALIGCLATFAVVAAIGWILGSNFGAFSIGWIVFGILSTKLPVLNDVQVKRWVFEGAIIVSTFCNQVSPQSSNASTLVTNDGNDSRSIQKEAWKVKSIRGYSAWTVQIAAAAVCILISGVCTMLGIN